jgi:hypothetical protein
MPNITVQWYAGRTAEQRREITAAITEAMVRIGKTTADQVHIVRLTGSGLDFHTFHGPGAGESPRGRRPGQDRLEVKA